MKHARAREAFVDEEATVKGGGGGEAASTSGRETITHNAGGTSSSSVVTTTTVTAPDAETPTGRLEWVIERAFDRKRHHNQTIDDFKRDADATWDFLEATWTRAKREDRRDAARVVRACFESKWASRVVGACGGGSACVPSIGVSRETIGMRKSSSAFSLDSSLAAGGGGGRRRTRAWEFITRCGRGAGV